MPRAAVSAGKYKTARGWTPPQETLASWLGDSLDAESQSESGGSRTRVSGRSWAAAWTCPGNRVWGWGRCPSIRSSGPCPHSTLSVQPGPSLKESTVGARDLLGLHGKTVLPCGSALVLGTSLSCALGALRLQCLDTHRRGFNPPVKSPHTL